MRWEKAFATGVRRLAKEREEELPDHPDYLPTSLIAPRVGHMLRALASGGKATSGSVQDLAHAILKNGDHHNLPILADALDEADTGEDNDPARWINWRNAGHGIELDKRVLGAMEERVPAAPGESAESRQTRLTHRARYGRMNAMDVIDTIANARQDGIGHKNYASLAPAVWPSIQRIGQHGYDAREWRTMSDPEFSDENRLRHRDNLLRHGDLVTNGYSYVPKENQLAALKSAVRYEEPADIKFPGE